MKRPGHKKFNAVSHNRSRPEVLFLNLTWRSRGQISSVLLQLLLFAFSNRKFWSKGAQLQTLKKSHQFPLKLSTYSRVDCYSVNHGSYILHSQVECDCDKHLFVDVSFNLLNFFIIFIPWIKKRSRKQG